MIGTINRALVILCKYFSYAADTRTDSGKKHNPRGGVIPLDTVHQNIFTETDLSARDFSYLFNTIRKSIIGNGPNVEFGTHTESQSRAIFIQCR